MNKVTVKAIPFKLIGESIEVGSLLQFKAKDVNDNDFNSNDIKGLRIISIFPALNTRVCDLQTARIGSWANQYKNVEFISITNDDVKTIAEWCIAHGLPNARIVSDRQYQDFGNKTNLLIKMWDKLARGFIILDENNKIIEMSFNPEQSAEPDYSMVEKYLK